MVGGGDSAMEEATFLTRFAQLGDGRPPARRAARLEDHAGARVRQPEDHVRAGTARWPEVLGDGQGHRAAAAGHRRPATRATLPVTGVFVAIGHDPRSELFTGQLATDADGYLLVEQPIDAHRDRRASSPAATSSTTPTGRPSPPPAPAARPRSTPSGTWLATRPDRAL